MKVEQARRAAVTVAVLAVLAVGVVFFGHAAPLLAVTGGGAALVYNGSTPPALGWLVWLTYAARRELARATVQTTPRESPLLVFAVICVALAVVGVAGRSERTPVVLGAVGAIEVVAWLFAAPESQNAALARAATLFPVILLTTCLTEDEQPHRRLMLIGLYIFVLAAPLFFTLPCAALLLGGLLLHVSRSGVGFIVNDSPDVP